MSPIWSLQFSIFWLRLSCQSTTQSALLFRVLSQNFTDYLSRQIEDILSLLLLFQRSSFWDHQRSPFSSQNSAGELTCHFSIQSNLERLVQFPTSVLIVFEISQLFPSLCSIDYRLISEFCLYFQIIRRNSSHLQRGDLCNTLVF